MPSILLTLLLIAFIFIAVVWKAKPRVNGEGFFDKEYTNTLKGICSIVVIFVHIPEVYQNPLQDALGSFAYVCVTGFFMISAFGMQYSLNHNPKYLASFPVNRLTALLIPNIIINIISWTIYCFIDPDNELSRLWTINHYVLVLLEYCAVFYVVNLLAAKLSWRRWISDVIMLAWVLGSSLFLYLTKGEDVTNSAQIGWCYERMGLAWGLLLYLYQNAVHQWLFRRYKAKLVMTLIASVILGLLYLKFKYTWFYGEYLLKICLGIVIVLFYFVLNHKFTLSNQFTRVLGNISYETYLAHAFIGYSIILIYPELNSGVYIWCIIGITLVFSYVVHRINVPLVRGAKSLCRRLHLC